MAAEVAVGIDVGGTKIAGGLVDAHGHVTCWQRVPTPRDDPGRILEAIGEVAAAIDRERTGSGLLPVGVGVPELVSSDGRVASSYTVDWTADDLRAVLAPRPVTVEADVRAAALAEARFGALGGQPTGVYVSLGTGISCCLVLDGVPHRGARGFAGLIGSGRLVTRCEGCGVLTHVALEEFASGAGIVERFTAEDGEAGQAEDVFSAAAAAVPAARQAVDDSAEAVGAALALLVNLIDPHAIVVGGGLSGAPEPYWRAVLAAARSHVWMEQAGLPPIERTRLGERIGVIGAAAGALRS